MYEALLEMPISEEKAFIQILLDFRFLGIIIEGQMSIELLKRSNKVVSKIKNKIDPVDVALFDEVLTTNASKYFSKLSIFMRPFFLNAPKDMYLILM